MAASDTTVGSTPSTGRGTSHVDRLTEFSAVPAYNPMLAQTLDGLMGLFRDRVLPFDTDAARRFAELAVTAKNGGRGFPTPDGYIAAIAASRGFIVASRDTAPYEAATVAVINPWKV